MNFHPDSFMLGVLCGLFSGVVGSTIGHRIGAEMARRYLAKKGVQS